MASLTPLDRREEVSDEAFNEGMVSGGITLFTTTSAVLLAHKYLPRFRQVTNNQSRTALAIMPALFMFAFTSEEKVVHRMKEIAEETQHSHNSMHWAERQLDHQREQLAKLTPEQAQKLQRDQKQEQEHLNELYRQAIYQSGVRVVPGELATHHKMANYLAENPFKVLASAAVPSVAWIFWGRGGKKHLDMSMKIMHTRVFGQFATISMLLGVMGFKEFMDRNGKFITEAQAEERVQEMQALRNDMLMRLEEKNRVQKQYDEQIAKAHEQDVLEHHVHEKKHKKKRKNKKKVVEEESQEVVATASAMAVSPSH